MSKLQIRCWIVALDFLRRILFAASSAEINAKGEACWAQDSPIETLIRDLQSEAEKQ